eukprot:TRINITY_DN87439_c0_g1_i1.p1 TRINITY_DN87439_c0_g1~~TRINITY_DN87439_c0_g1_i1.p1  ORF type:complete len:987 (+),score=128.20 TRINITY_DN87439_c0_g1_i1:78-3038(+)
MSTSLACKGTSSTSLNEAMQDPESAVFKSAASRDVNGLSFAASLTRCLAVTVPFAGVTVGLWSEMGCGSSCLAFMQRHRRQALLSAGLSGVLLLLLYMLDFFMPPHLPGRFLTLFDGDPGVGRSLLGLSALGVIGTCYFSAYNFPTAPLALTIFSCPIALIFVRQMTKPKTPCKAYEAGSEASLQDRLAMLTVITRAEQEQRHFYQAATAAFVVTGLASVSVWVPWAVTRELHMSKGLNAGGWELAFVQWAAPLMLSIAYLVFASFTGIRVYLDRAYANTDPTRSQILLCARSHSSEEVMEHQIHMLQANLDSAHLASGQSLDKTRDRAQQYLVQKSAHMRLLSCMVKTVGCGFIVILGALYVTFQLTVVGSHIAELVQFFLVAFLVTFYAFMFFSFQRLWQDMSGWLKDLPIWKSMTSLLEADWARAIALSLLVPALPVLLFLSSLNQAVRRCRNLEGVKHHRGCLTERVGQAVASARQWNWTSIISWSYVIAHVIMLYTIIPIFLNVLLAWMSSAVAQLHFVGILTFTFVAGMVLFMLPPVPGPPIYLFGGMVIADHCPMGFWWGTIICIVLCIVLKLMACALQQKIIGERLGSKESVRRAVGVHRPFIRAIEKILQRPGLCFGKCMILCGGPDWPTSVLAGILRLSLVQCLIGTLPVIASLVPLALTGSFYLRRDDGDVWIRAGNLMFSLTAIVSIGFWAGMGWAIQDEFDKHSDELVAPRAEFVDLDWLDYRAGRLQEQCALLWSHMPWWLQVIHPGGALVMVAVAQLFFWRSSLCFGYFKVTDDVSDLAWFSGWNSEDGMIKPLGLASLGAVALACICQCVSMAWRIRRSLRLSEQASQVLALEETAWKAQRIQEAQRWCKKSASPKESLSGTSPAGDPSSHGIGSISSDTEACVGAAPGSPTSEYSIAIEHQVRTMPEPLGKPVWLKASLEKQAQELVGRTTSEFSPKKNSASNKGHGSPCITCIGLASASFSEPEQHKL